MTDAEIMAFCKPHFARIFATFDRIEAAMATPIPTPEQEAHAKWDLLLADLDHRLEQIRRTQQERHLAPWQVAFAGLTSGAAIFAAGAAFMKLFG